MQKIKKFSLIFSLLVLFPMMTFALDSRFVGTCSDGSGMLPDGTCSGIPISSTCDSLNGIGKIICQFKEILNSIVPVLVALGVVYFVWGVVQYVIADGEEAKKKGKDRIIYGVIGFAVIIGLWGLVNIITTTFGLGGTTPPSLSSVGGGTGSTSTLTSNPKFQDVLTYITGIINSAVIPLIFAVATVMFVWGVVQFFILNADEEAKRAQGKQFMIWGIIALAVMLSVWGLVGILGTTFGVGTSVLPQVTPPH
ncbi:MAG: pilin [Candidatus Pacebacteria bacterium]|nr:pilin [Candidatus Paceibacterota bacterium]